MIGPIKASVISFTRTLAMELAEHNINVNCVIPDLTHSPLVERLAAQNVQLITEARGMSIDEYFDKFRRARILMKRKPMPEDIGYAVVFLASEDAKNITGQSLNINGGSRMD